MQEYYIRRERAREREIDMYMYICIYVYIYIYIDYRRKYVFIEFRGVMEIQMEEHGRLSENWDHVGIYRENYQSDGPRFLVFLKV